MKTINIILAIIALAISFTACDPDHIEMTTVVNTDGSFCRTIRFEADSLTMAGEKTERKHLVDVLGNDKWQKSWEVVPDTSAENANKNKFFCTASRVFDDMTALNDNYPIEINGTKILKQGEVERRFCGFYTDITFREVYTDLSSVFAVPGNLFLTREELSYWWSGYPNIIEGLSGNEAAKVLNDIEVKFNMWHMSNDAYDRLTIIADNYDSFEKCPLSRDEILAVRDKAMSNEFWKEIHKKYADKDINVLDNIIIKEILDTDYFSKEGKDRLVNLTENSDYSDKYVNIGNGDEIAYNLVMPGKIISKGIGTLKEGNVICFSITGLHLLSPEYTIEATSRVINWWFVVLTGLIVILPIGIAIYLRRNK